ncbi:CRISPR-associated protein Cas5 [Methanobacterium alkalithermotolerans]|nr:CRISPR-associated protein Cas5 [Methanobacterium alkalithermotolerans]
MAIEMNNYKNIIEIDIWSSFGCFTKPFSNTGGLLTYLIPPKTSIIGMIAAILGYEFDDYEELEDKTRKYKIEELYDIKVSIQALFDLKIKRVTFNSHYGNEPHMLNVHEDVLINPFYKVYLSFPSELKDKEKIFLERVMANETVYNLYMGRNEFFMNYEFKNYFEGLKPYVLDNSNENDFFEDKKDQKVYGTLDKTKINNVKLFSKITETTIFGTLKQDIKKLASYYEYIIRDYPVKRYNFVNFNYIPVSFYSMHQNDTAYFSKLSLNENEKFELYEIGENEWISLI